jgi:ribosomal protein L22
MQPIRQLIVGEKFDEACRRLENLLKTHRGQFPELLLMAQLYHQVNRNDRAAKCLLQMIHSAEEDTEQFAAMRLYHQLVNPIA